MGDRDYAVVVGIADYAHFDCLEGPENDAKAVIDWLRDPDGGAVPEGQIHKMVSSEFPKEGEKRSRPMTDEVHGAFGTIRKLGVECDPEPVGRRLYIFMAGHGWAPAKREAALFAANAEPRAHGFSVSGGKIADYFSDAEYFEEIILLMDCCRDRNATAEDVPLRWDSVSGQGGKEPVWLYGYATGYSSRAREKPIDGVTRGLFTVAVLEALRAGASTSSELADLVRERMVELMDKDDYQRPLFQGDNANELDLGARGARVPLIVTLASADRPMLVSIKRGGKLPSAGRRRLGPGESLEFTLRPGLYDVRCDQAGFSKLVSLTVEPVHVTI